MFGEYPETETFATTCRFRIMLVREDPEPFGPEMCSQPAQAAALLHRLFTGFDREVLGALYLDTKHRAIGHTVAYVGTINRTAAEPRGIIVPALLSNAVGIIVFHNHPSGDPTPSAEDLHFTRKLSEAAEIVGLKLVDHLILGDSPSFVSLKERGCW